MRSAATRRMTRSPGGPTTRARGGARRSTVTKRRMADRQRRRKPPIGGTHDAERHGGGGQTGRRGARRAAPQPNEVRRRGRGREIGESGRTRLIRLRQRVVAPKRKLRRNKPLHGRGQSAADQTMSRPQGRGPPRADGGATARVASTDRLRQMRYPRRSSRPFGLVARCSAEVIRAARSSRGRIPIELPHPYRRL